MTLDSGSRLDERLVALLDGGALRPVLEYACARLGLDGGHTRLTIDFTDGRARKAYTNAGPFGMDALEQLALRAAPPLPTQAETSVTS